MFYDAENFNGAVNGFEMGGATTISEMFRGAKAFDGTLKSWNLTSHDSSCARLFENASNFQGTGLEDWARVEGCGKDLTAMFKNTKVADVKGQRWAEHVGNVVTSLKENLSELRVTNRR